MHPIVLCFKREKECVGALPPFLIMFIDYTINVRAFFFLQLSNWDWRVRLSAASISSHTLKREHWWWKVDVNTMINALPVDSKTGFSKFLCVALLLWFFPLEYNLHHRPLLFLVMLVGSLVDEKKTLRQKKNFFYKKKQGRKRPLDTPKRMIKRRERERKVKGKI